MKRRLGWLVGGTLLVWLVAVYPVQTFLGERDVVYSTVAVALCLVPTSLTLLWAGWAWRQAPEQQLVMVLGGTAVRMGSVLGVSLMLWQLVPYFSEARFWTWVLVYYLLTLGLEVVSIAAGQPAVPPQKTEIA